MKAKELTIHVSSLSKLLNKHVTTGLRAKNVECM